MGKRTLLIIILLAIAAGFIQAQAQPPRDYTVTNIDYEFADDHNRFTLSFTVLNQGGDAPTTAPVVVRLLTEEGRELLQDEIRPLAAGETLLLQLPFDVTLFPANSRQSISVSVGLDSYELAGSALAQDNTQAIIVPIPARGAAPPAQAAATAAPESTAPNTDRSAPATEAAPIVSFEANGVALAGRQFDHTQVALAAVIFVAAVVLLWLLSLILRLIFRRPPRFPTWQPPYSLITGFDQHSVEGRRQAWQQHAQNGLILTPPTEGNLAPVKLLLSSNDENLQNWKVTTMRLSQYDSYGRIARSQMIAPHKWVRRLNRAIRKAPDVETDQLYKIVQPVAAGLVKEFKKQINDKNAFLPVAFDMRLEGAHGDVRIMFELYQCRQRSWFRIDEWEPAMIFVNTTLHENYTYTIHGRQNNEKLRDYYKRLSDDLTWLLMETLRIYEPQPEEIPHQNYNVPDTLSGMAPVTEQSMNAAHPESALDEDLDTSKTSPITETP